MDLDPAWVPVLSGFGGGALVWAGTIINDWITHRRDEKRRIREEKQKWVESRRNAYYKFIDVFSTYVTNPDPHDYFQSAFEAAMYGDVIIPTPFKTKQYSFLSDINSLDLLLAALIFMKSDYSADSEFGDLKKPNIKEIHCFRAVDFSLSKNRLLKQYNEMYRQHCLKQFPYRQGINNFVSIPVQLL